MNSRDKNGSVRCLKLCIERAFAERFEGHILPGARAAALNVFQKSLRRKAVRSDRNVTFAGIIGHGIAADRFNPAGFEGNGRCAVFRDAGKGHITGSWVLPGKAGRIKKHDDNNDHELHNVIIPHQSVFDYSLFTHDYSLVYL